MTTVSRVLVALDSHDLKAWQVAATLADKMCVGGPSGREVVLLVHTKAQLDHTDLSGHIGAAQAKILSRGGTLNLPSGAKLRSATMKTLSHVPAQTVGIVYWAEPGILDHVDGLRNLVGVIAVPEFPASADAWEERWQPTVYGRPARPAATALITDPTVANALQTLTSLVNLSTGLVHPRDKEHAKDILRILRAHGHKADPEKVKSWAITNGWRPKDAAELATLADKILGQKTKPSLSRIHNAQGRYERWR